MKKDRTGWRNWALRIEFWVIAAVMLGSMVVAVRECVR